MLLKEGRGSPGHMEGLGVQYHEHRIIVSIVGDAVTGSLVILLPCTEEAYVIGGPLPFGFVPQSFDYWPSAFVCAPIFDPASRCTCSGAERSGAIHETRREQAGACA